MYHRRQHPAACSHQRPGHTAVSVDAGDYHSKKKKKQSQCCNVWQCRCLHKENLCQPPCPNWVLLCNDTDATGVGSKTADEHILMCSLFSLSEAPVAPTELEGASHADYYSTVCFFYVSCQLCVSLRGGVEGSLVHFCSRMRESISSYTWPKCQLLKLRHTCRIY